MFRVIVCFLMLMCAIDAEGKTILITGASRGMGYAAAKVLAEKGHRVYAGVRNVKDDDAFPEAISQIQLDVTDEECIARAVEEIVQKEGRLDVVINNAGCGVFGPVELITVEQAKKLFDVNFFGTMRMIQAALPVMREQGTGLIINMSSTSGIRPSPGWDIYGASKYAIEGLSEGVAAMAHLWNIDIVVLEPGTTSTRFMQDSTEIGCRKTDKTAVYDNFMPYAIRWMDERLAEGQDPMEVAEVIATIVDSEKRHLRYQTSPKGTQTVASRHCDPTGDKSVKEQELLIQKLWKGPLDTREGSSFR